ncbi:MAG: TetR/AcrR family transcriptional regulator [Ruminococcaceae bacterium]|nr:TetR/AcrR family transcriptional regulator [Oscillospiraceae bacterium]
MTIKDAKLNFIIDVATELFLERSIATVTVKDIADRAGVGEATIYRYFKQKQNLVCAVAEKLQKQVFQEYYATISGSGYAKLEAFFEAYTKIFANHREFYRFIGDFDAYLLSENLSAGKSYSDGVDHFRNLFLSAYQEGIADGSVRKLEADPEVFYYATAHAMLALCKNRSVEREIVPQDGAMDKQIEVDEMKRVILFSLAAPQTDAE